MPIRLLAVVGALALGAAATPWSGVAAPTSRSALGDLPAAVEPRVVVPTGAHRADPADSLYRLAREAFNRGDYADAAERFEQLVERHPDSEYRASALYYGAYANYRVGGDANLRTALALLEAHASAAPGEVHADADALRARVTGALARRGDADAAVRVVREARELNGAAVGEGARTSEGARAAAGTAIPASEASSTQPSDCPRDGDDARIAALNALMQMSEDQALPLLRRVLARRDACAAPLRRKAVFLVAQQGEGAGREELLLDIVRNDPDPEVRSQAVFWMSSLESPRATEILVDLLRTSTDDRVRDRALFALSQQSSSQARQALRDFATRAEAPERLRERAIFWLGQNQADGNGEFLRDLYGRLEDESLKERTLFALSQSKDAAARAWLLARARDASETPRLRGRAIFWLAQGDALPTSELAGLYDALEDRAVKEQTIFALSQRADAAAVDKLMGIARAEQDRRLRERAIFWLGQSKDPRVPEFLMSIIDR